MPASGWPRTASQFLLKLAKGSVIEWLVRRSRLEGELGGIARDAEIRTAQSQGRPERQDIFQHLERMQGGDRLNVCCDGGCIC